MNVKEWALIAFTILTQMSVGAFVVMGIVHLFVARKAGREEADRMSERVLVAIGGTLILGMVASLFHLGNIFDAPKSLNNLGSSWLSREIVFGVAFAALGFLFTLLQWRKIGSATFRNAVAVIAAVVGIIFVFCQSQVYMIPIQPAWNTWATPVTFYTATMLLGVMSIGPALVASYLSSRKSETAGDDNRFELLRNTIKWMALASILLVGIELIVIPMYLLELSTMGSAALGTLQLLSGKYSVALALRLILSFIGAGILAVFIYRDASTSGKGSLFIRLTFLAFALVFIAEVLGRFLFYATASPIGLTLTQG